jgi:sugar phosphate isomerase/epimerase
MTLPSPNRLGIEQLTVLAMPPVEYIQLAAELGCVSISTGVTGMPLTMFGIEDYQPWREWSLRDDPVLRRETVAAIRDTGVKIGLAEGFRAASDADVSVFAQDLDIFAELGALRVNAICMEDDMALAVDQLGKLADMAIARGMAFTIEFFPSEGINCFERALEVVEGIGRDKAKVLLDTMHFFRTGGTLEKLRAAGTDSIGYVQLSDSADRPPDETYFMKSLFARDVPGEGRLPLREIVAALPPDMPISVEVPRLDDIRAMGTHAHTARVIAAARAVGA